MGGREVPYVRLELIHAWSSLRGRKIETERAARARIVRILRDQVCSVRSRESREGLFCFLVSCCYQTADRNSESAIILLACAIFMFLDSEPFFFLWLADAGGEVTSCFDGNSDGMASCRTLMKHRATVWVRAPRGRYR